MIVTNRKYKNKDYDEVMNFFRRLYRVSDKIPHWLPARFEYAEYLVSPLHKQRVYLIDWKETIYLWEKDESEVVALVSSEDPDKNVFIHILPEFRNLEEEMIKVAEEYIIRQTLKEKEIDIWCQEDDVHRETILDKLGYQKKDEIDYLNWRDLSGDLPESNMPTGYTLHDMVGENDLDLQHKIDQNTRAFDSPTFPIEIYRHMQQGPSYRTEYDLYTTNIDGKITSNCTIWYDKELNIGYLEPVSTDSDHRRIGLGQATLYEGLKRLKQDGIIRAYVGSYGKERRAFYNACGFTNYVAFHPWTKSIT